MRRVMMVVVVVVVLVQNQTTSVSSYRTRKPKSSRRLTAGCTRARGEGGVVVLVVVRLVCEAEGRFLQD